MTMNDPAPASNVWDEAPYQRLRDAHGAEQTLTVTFENGDQVELGLTALLNTHSAHADWDTLNVSPYELSMNVEGDAVTVPWMDIRALGDQRLATHLAEQAHQQAQHVGHRLRLLRTRRGLSSRALAERAGISPQSLSRIERGRHDVVFSTLQRLLAAMHLNLTDLAALGDSEIEPRQVRAALTALGLERETIRRILHGVDEPPTVFDRVKRIFGWSHTDLTGTALPPVLGGPALAGRFKEQTRGSRATSTYVMYAHTLALLAEQASERPPYTPPPDNPAAIAAEIRDQHGQITFASLLEYCWEHGIVVIPLLDHGQMHGACWLIAGRPVIVLKQRAAYNSRWAFDLAHELAHVLRHLNGEGGIVELEEIGKTHDAEETEASEFASHLLLEDPESLLQEVVSQANGNGPRLKSALVQVSIQRHVDVGVLANALAWRLQLQKFPFPMWSVANNLQQGDRDAPDTARRALERHLDRGRMSPDDALLLRGALGAEYPEEVPA